MRQYESEIKELRGDVFQRTIRQMQFKRLPLLVKLFGKKEIGSDTLEYGNSTCTYETHAKRFRGNLYIYDSIWTCVEKEKKQC